MIIYLKILKFWVIFVPQILLLKMSKFNLKNFLKLSNPQSMSKKLCEKPIEMPPSHHQLCGSIVI